MNTPLRVSWDTNVKHFVRLGLDNTLPKELQQHIPKSNKYRWKKESKDKYIGCDVSSFINQDIALYKRISLTTNVKKSLEAYFRLLDTLYVIIGKVTGIKQLIAANKDLVVNTIENLKEYIPVQKAIKTFNLSRATYQNYKILVQHNCDTSYFLWCVKQYPQQLLKKEILQIKKYMEDQRYKYWSKSSIYLIAVRNKNIACGLSTWYKYCKILGYGKRYLYPKKQYSSLISHKPNELWCADVTIFKTSDGVKHHIHFLMDHFSKMILGYRVEKSSQGKAIKELIQNAFIKYTPTRLHFLTDGGSENVNSTVADYINLPHVTIKHLIAQKDIQFSNSKIEAFNKIIKHQFLLPKLLANRKQLEKALCIAIPIYNNLKPQWSLAGNTPIESFKGIKNDFTRFSKHISLQKKIRITENQLNKCTVCK